LPDCVCNLYFCMRCHDCVIGYRKWFCLELTHSPPDVNTSCNISSPATQHSWVRICFNWRSINGHNREAVVFHEKGLCMQTPCDENYSDKCNLRRTKILAAKQANEITTSALEYEKLKKQRKSSTVQITLHSRHWNNIHKFSHNGRKRRLREEHCIGWTHRQHIVSFRFDSRFNQSLHCRDELLKWCSVM